MRELITLRVCGWDLVGTHNMPPESARRQTGFLFVNPGHVPRDGHGGLAAKASDRLAKIGFPCFRFDMPGLGDTKGELPTMAETLYDFVASGGYAPIATELARMLRDRFSLDGLIMGGLCGASVTGIYAADCDPRTVRALILLEPEVFKTIPQGQDRPPETQDPRRSANPIEMVASKVFSYWGWMTLLTAENHYAKYVPLPRQAILKALMHSHDLPAVANVPLVEAWQRVRARRTPTLVVTAKGKIRELFFDRINHVALERIGTAGMHHVRIEGTNHIFTTGGAIERVIQLIEDWSHRARRV